MISIKVVVSMLILAMILLSYFLTTQAAVNVEYRRIARFTQSGGTYTLNAEGMPGWNTSISRSSVGVVVVGYQAFPATPFCGCNAEDNAVMCQVTSVTTTGAAVKMWAPSVLLGIANPADSNFTIICVQGVN